MATRPTRDALLRRIDELEDESRKHEQVAADLTRSQQVITGILQVVPTRIFWKDRDLVYLGCNMAFASDAGFPDPKDVVGKDDFQMVWRAQAEAYRNDDRQVIESGRAKLMIEESQTTPAGTTITLLTSKAPLRDADGRITGVLGTYMDISDRKLMERALEEEHHRLREALETVKTLHGILPICSLCKQIRDDRGAWNRLEKYVTAHSEAQFSHGICPTCAKTLYGELADDD